MMQARSTWRETGARRLGFEDFWFFKVSKSLDESVANTNSPDEEPGPRSPLCAVGVGELDWEENSEEYSSRFLKGFI